ncbi:hypothetical protein BMS3Abin07_00955 [bacterium BMS3Abin07]|nr:hypothetical protein BMS3Abin07_00955 [bacterium BMS3Abin07]GBE31225.1 hypothetical protein BMS3Bbin05_00124 [bacterium BMS3Bbin05]
MPGKGFLPLKWTSQCHVNTKSWSADQLEPSNGMKYCLLEGWKPVASRLGGRFPLPPLYICYNIYLVGWGKFVNHLLGVKSLALTLIKWEGGSGIFFKSPGGEGDKNRSV